MRDIFILLKQKYYHIYLFSPLGLLLLLMLFFEHLCAFNLYLILFNMYAIHTSIYTIYCAVVYCMDIYVCFFHFLAVAQFGLAPGRGNSNHSNKSPRSPSALAQCRQLPYRQLPLINGSQRNPSNQTQKIKTQILHRKKCVMRDKNKT